MDSYCINFFHDRVVQRYYLQIEYGVKRGLVGTGQEVK